MFRIYANNTIYCTPASTAAHLPPTSVSFHGNQDGKHGIATDHVGKFIHDLTRSDHYRGNQDLDFGTPEAIRGEFFSGEADEYMDRNV